MSRLEDRLPKGGVVVVTMVAAESFDPRLIWDGIASTESEPAAEASAVIAPAAREEKGTQ